MTTTPPVGPATPPPEKPATTPNTQAAPSQADQTRFSKALDNKRDDTSNAGKTADPKMSSDNPSALFRRRDTPDQQRGQDRGQSDGRGRDAREKDKALERDPAAPPPADAILRNFAPQPGEVEQVDAPARPEASLSDMVNQVANRILVGDSAATGQPEVRILLKDDVLGGTEIRIREEGGAVQVEFAAANKDIENFLASRQDEIATELGERLERDIDVKVMDRDGASNQSGDQRGRDRQQGQPGDGRSRNQRSAQDERED